MTKLNVQNFQIKINFILREIINLSLSGQAEITEIKKTKNQERTPKN